ncbi:MAG: histidine kinase family protein [Myxococcaceae bacterium]|nr:histidine kinase family protein [Myxococcaceae bacterium]
MPSTHRAGLFAGTLRSLAAPRRAVPLALVAASLWSAEWAAFASPAAMFVDAVLMALFCAVAPTLWRWLFARPLPSFAHHLGAWALYALAAGAIVVGVGVLLPPRVGLEWTYVSEPHSLGVLMALFLVGGWGLGRDIELEASAERERARADRLAVDAEHAQILALRAQLDPHFLFNTLNAIAEWCREDPVVAERATLDLAALLRAVFDALRAPGWALARELALLEQLAALYTARDAGRYRFRFEVAPAATAREVPALVLLPLFENAIKHGPAAGHEGEVVTSVRDDHGDALVSIENPGAFGGPRDGGQGLASVQRRLALAYGEDTHAAFTSAGGTTRVTVRLPPRTLDGGAP